MIATSAAAKEAAMNVKQVKTVENSDVPDSESSASDISGAPQS